MTPKETRFVGVLVDSGLISFQEAGGLEGRQEQVRKETGEHQPVWDIAVADGVITQAQAERFLARIDEFVATVTRTAAATQELDTRHLAPAPRRAGEAAGSGAKRLGAYLLLSKLGQGGMGAVYKAHQESMDRTVAIKVLPRNLAANQEFIGRFLREARAAGRLSHPNVVAGIDAGFADGYYYFAMEYVEGRSLGDRLKEGPLDEAEAVDIGLQMAAALEHAHAAGLVHRDVKPENILVTLGGQAKLCDLGLARSAGDDMRITQAGLAVGTPYYVSPEQVRGLEPDVRADVYSLGATLYHLVTGRVPFDGENPMAVMQKHLNETPPRPAEVRPHGVSQAFDAVIVKMMARDAARRYQTMADAAADLRKVRAGEIPASLVGAMAQRRIRSGRGTRGTASARAVTDATGTTRAVGPARRFPVKMAAAAGSALVFAGVLAAFLALRGGSGGDGQDRTKAVQPDPEKERLDRLTAELEAVRVYERDHPGEYGKLIDRYDRLLAGAEGTGLAGEARAALAAVKQRRDQDQSKERLEKLSRDLEAIAAFEKADPGKYAEAIEKYTTFLGGAAGTDYEARAQAASEATRKRRADRAGELLAAARKAVGAEQEAGRFGDALAGLKKFPPEYRPVVAKELAQIEASILAAGKARWEAIRTEALGLAAKHRFDEAGTAAGKGKSLGLAEAEAWVSQALADIEKARLVREEELAAGYRKQYDEFARAFDGLARAGKFDEAVASGQPLAGRLGEDLDRRLAADLALATGARDFLKSLRGRLAKAPEGAFGVTLPLGRARFVKYHADGDRLDFKFGAGSTSLALGDFEGGKLVDLARRSAGGELPAAEALGAASWLLARGEVTGVAALAELARAGGQDVSVLQARLAVAERGAREVEAEGLLARFDEQMKAGSWQAAAQTGGRLLKEFAETAAVTARKDLAALVDQAGHNGSPLAVYEIVLQPGVPAPAIGLADYRGCRAAAIYKGTSEAHRTTPSNSRDLMYCGESGNWAVLVRFALTRSEGGPLPDDAEILGARLCLAKLDGYAPYLVLQGLARDWNEAEVTWRSAAAGSDWKTEGADAAGDAAVCDVGAAYAEARRTGPEAAAKVWDGPYWCEFDVTESLRAGIRNRANFGWRVTAFSNEKRDGEVATPRLKFAGRLHAADPALRPRLILKVRCRRLAAGAPAQEPGTPVGAPVEVALQDGLNVGGAVYAGTRDTYIVGGGETVAKANFGDKDRMKSGLSHTRMLVRFAVFRSEGGPVPDGAQIASARLCLFKERAYPSGLGAYEILRDWDERAVTHHDTGRGAAWSEPGCEAAGKDRASEPAGECAVGYAKGQWARIDVTSSLRAWSAGKLRNCGWVIVDQSADTANLREYCSREYADDPTKRPRLEVVYSVKR